MKVRIRFSKTGALVYISHLDIMRYFQKLFRRAGIPVRYSEGFSPHQILSFSNPLPLGMESTGEYADVELTDSIPSAMALENLRTQSVPEIGIMSFKMLDDKSENAMAAVRAARYSAGISDADLMKKMQEAIEVFLLRENVTVTKKTKKNETEINIRPLVHELKISSDINGLEMLISSGSTDNIKPELVLGALCDIAGIPFDKNRFVIKRIDQYTQLDDRILSLDDVGTDII